MNEHRYLSKWALDSLSTIINLCPNSTIDQLADQLRYSSEFITPYIQELVKTNVIKANIIADGAPTTYTIQSKYSDLVEKESILTAEAVQLLQRIRQHPGIALLQIIHDQTFSSKEISNNIQELIAANLIKSGDRNG